MQEYFSDQDLAYRYGVSRITPWRWTRAGKFPPPMKLGENITRWSRASVEAWEAERAAELERQVAKGLIPQEHETVARTTSPWIPAKKRELPRADAKQKPRKAKTKGARRGSPSRASSRKPAHRAQEGPGQEQVEV